MKRFLVGLLLGASFFSNVSAATPARKTVQTPPNTFFAGAAMGETRNKYSLKQLGLSQGVVHYEGFTGRVFAGYQFNRRIGVEAGWLRVGPARVTGLSGTTDKARISDSVYDMLINANYPLRYNYFVTAKVGAGYHVAKPDTLVKTRSTTDFKQSTVAHFRPVYGLGLGYALNQKLRADVSWTHVQSHRVMAPVDYVSLGLRYYF